MVVIIVRREKLRNKEEVRVTWNKKFLSRLVETWWGETIRKCRRRRRQRNRRPETDDDETVNYALINVEKIVSRSPSLFPFPSFPSPSNLYGQECN